MSEQIGDDLSGLIPVEPLADPRDLTVGEAWLLGSDA